MLDVKQLFVNGLYIVDALKDFLQMNDFFQMNEFLQINNYNLRDRHKEYYCTDN